MRKKNVSTGKIFIIPLTEAASIEVLLTVLLNIDLFSNSLMDSESNTSFDSLNWSKIYNKVPFISNASEIRRESENRKFVV